MDRGHPADPILMWDLRVRHEIELRRAAEGVPEPEARRCRAFEFHGEQHNDRHRRTAAGKPGLALALITSNPNESGQEPDPR